MIDLIFNRTSGAKYNLSDLNRVGAAAEYVARRLAERAYFAEVSSKTDWEMASLPTAAQMEIYLQNVRNLREAYFVRDTTADLPADMRKLWFYEANAIEQNLFDMDFLIDKMDKISSEFKKCGDFYCGTQDFKTVTKPVFIMRGFNKSRRTWAELDALGATWAEILEGAWL